ncbi:myosin phosphatase Rho-interacting protein isoform X3 [Myripristis murdjan]|uniref:myosin phosphatase Rho-interacting protein isoform X3 n=1 Tax=Myripristis murdjan TaxID=586833 RepID=UPI00117627ED|nr:myosin phosphatase Rho-interacting protein isoform X3 [Myripristis murdjan]
MSSKDNPCRKFQANIFNKSKCQNCFKPRESHLLNDEDLNQAKPIYGGWLLLAPEGTNFDNPLHRSRKWQRRFFILYEHGLLRYALDEMPSTLPQGTINMNQCSDVIDGESRTGQKNSLCILTPDKEHFIRAECKEIINGWQEALTVYPRTNKQNQKKKRKVEPPTHQGGVTPSRCFSTGDMNGHPEPGPAKVTVTSSGGSIPCLPSSIASAERVPASRASLWQEEGRWSRATIPCSRSASCISQLAQSHPGSGVTSQDDGSTMSSGRKVRVESGYFSLEKTKSEPSAQPAQPSQPPQHLPLSSSASSSSLGAPHRYNAESDPHTSPYYPSPDSLPSPGALLSPSYSTISSSQSSLDSEPSSSAPSWDGRSVGGGSVSSVGGGGGRVGRSGREYAALSDVPRARRLSYREAFRSEKKRQELRARTRSPGREEVARLFGEERRRSQVIERFEDGQHVERMDTSSSTEPSANTVLIQRQGRSERRYLANKQDLSLDAGKERSAPDVSISTFSNLRRAKSLDRRVTESSMTPDLLNFKKGWMTKLYEDGMWKKHWFVLTDQSLKYYKDSIAEEASDPDGEIDLSTCYDVTEFPVQRNYGFQILCKEGACTLSAMTSGIRRNWIQAIMKNVRPTIAPDVTRKNISLKLSVLKPRSLPEEKVKAQVVLEPCTQPSPEPSPTLEAPRVDIHIQSGGNSVSVPASELRKSRVRERRREGRSKTYDWSEFKGGQTEKPMRNRAETVDLSSPSSSSTASSSCSSSSSPSSPGSYPLSTASSPQTSSVSSSQPPSVATTEEADKERARWHEERKGILQHTATSAPHTPNTVTMVTTLNTTSGVHPWIPERQDQGKMEVDHPSAMNSDASEEKIGQRGSRTTDVQIEIEHRWHQVETTPLREEKQVPITSAIGNSVTSDRLPPHELAALLDKELGQKQKELDRLQEQNNLLQEQLEDARGREQSAREGYVLQSAPSSTPPSTSPHRVPWQRLHKLNQDLQGELEAQKHKQDLAQQQVKTLKRSYTEAQDAVRHHEADIQALQSKLASAMAEIVASERAVARMRNELKLEQERSREQEEDWGHSEATLRAQLRDSEDRLREVEASLLERNQALRHLEHQQALQRDHLREVQRLQERLQEVTARLTATEEGQALKEERLRNEQHSMQESHERERQTLSRRLAEAITARKEMEDKLLEAEQQVEALLRGRQASGGKEDRVEVLKLQEELAQKTDMVETLRESVRRLEEEKGQLTCHCQELLNQIAEADREVNKLRSRLETEEADYYTLEHSYERASEEFQKMSQFLKEKEEEIRQTKEMYERLVERKEEDLKEALVKMTALGNSLEETEQKLQAKEELLCQMSHSVLDKVEPCSAERDLQAKLVVAEDRIAELEQHLNALHLGYAGLCMERQQMPERHRKERVNTSNSLPTNTELSLAFDTRSKTNTSSDGKESQAKRPRIRFSSIQCQKYISLEGLDTSNVSSTFKDSQSQKLSQDVSQDIHSTEESSTSDITFHYASDPEKFISIIHALETKLLATEDKLRTLTQNLKEQKGGKAEDLPKSDLKETDNKPHQEKEPSFGTGCQINAASIEYAKALECVETSREKVRAILSGSHGTTDLQLHSLSEIENELFNATLYIKQGEKTLEENSLQVQQNQTQETLNSRELDEDTMHLFAKTLSFEAVVLNKMALLIQNSESDLLQGLAKIQEDIKSIKRDEEDYLAIVYADVLTRKLMLESAFWKELEKIETQFEHSDVAKSREGKVSSGTDIDATVILNTFFKAELAYSFQNLKHFYEEKFRTLKRELTEAHNNLQKRELALKAIFEALKRPDLKNVVKEVKNNFGFSQQRLADIRPPELAPYMEQIEMEEARDLAEEVIDRQLAGDMPSCSVDTIESLQNAQDSLAHELQRQASILHRYAQEIESGGSHPEVASMIRALAGHQATHNFTSSSLCMREALIQAQVAYVACRLRAIHERDLGQCQQAGQHMDALVKEHAHNVSAIQEKYEASLQEERLSFTQTVDILQKENHTLKNEISKRVNQLSQQQEQLSHLEKHFQKETEELRQKHKQELSQAEQGRASTELVLMETTADSQRKLEVLLLDMDTMEERHEGHVRKLQEQFQERISELQHIHKEEIQKLHAQYMDTIRCIQEHQQGTEVPEISFSLQHDEATAPMEEEEQGKGEEEHTMCEVDPMVVLKDRIQELETQMNTMRDELENKHLEGDVASLREKYQRDFESLKATCERGFAAMEETHQKVIEDLQRQHQREVSKLMEERERLLAEETAATIAAIEAMKNAHKEELEKTQRSQLSGLNSDIDELRLQYEEELQSVQRELEVLSEQYSQKCLENAHLAQALEAERQALRQCQRENQELNAHNQELNNRLTAEITRMRSCFSGETAMSPLTQGKDVYELEVLLRIKESEIQYLKQEIHSLKDELQSALRDKKYATDKYKDIYTELSIVKAKADCDISKLKEKLLVATEALGERTVDGAVTPGYDIMKSKSNPDFMKKERSANAKQTRGVRSKSVTEQVSWDS